MFHPNPLAYIVIPLYPIASTLFLQGASSNGIEYFGSLGVGGILAGVLFYFYRQDRKATEALLADRLKENTAAIKELVAIIAKHDNH